MYHELRKRGTSMAAKKREIYSSPNGDRWYLACDDSGRVHVEHVPNVASGGQPSQIEVGSFLARGARGPEHQELLRLIATLVDARDA
jgi:hypothetical protein